MQIAPKSVTEVFVSPIDDVFPEISEDSVDFSSISAISEANYCHNGFSVNLELEKNKMESPSVFFN